MTGIQSEVRNLADVHGGLDKILGPNFPDDGALRFSKFENLC